MYLKNYYVFLVSVFLFVFHSNGQATKNYLTLEQIQQNLQNLTKANQGDLKSIGKSRGGRDLWVARFGADTNPAILFVSGLDGNHPSGVQSNFLWMQKLVQSPNFKNLTANKTAYFLLVGNPDAYAAYFQKLKREKRGNDFPSDDNRNGAVGDDPMEDLNKDGLITMMRVEDATGDYVIDLEDARWMSMADASKNQQGTHKLFTEGIDNNKNGQFNEDASEGVIIDKNFAFDYPVFEKGSGIYAVSEPETRAIMDFVMTKPNIHSVFHFALQNNLSEGYKYDAKTATQRIIRSWMEKDVKVQEQVSKAFNEAFKTKETTKLAIPKGSFSATMYYHAGKFSFAHPGWFPSIAKDTTKGKDAKADKKMESAEKIFLKWMDQEKLTSNFVNWTPINHTDFPNQKVEVGGIVPHAMWNPPFSYLEKSMEETSVFLLKYFDYLPTTLVTNPKVEKLEGNLYRVTVSITNKGFLPSYAEIGDKIRFTSKLKTELLLQGNQKRVAGKKIDLHKALQPNESYELTWLVQGSGKITIQSGCATTGVSNITLDLK